MENIAVVSDLHWQSEQGLTNPFVKDKFLDFVKRMPKKCVGVINGDIFQGIDRRWIDQLKRGDFVEELKENWEILQKFYDKCRIVGSTSGTKSHSYAGFVNMERVIMHFWGSKVHKAQLTYRSKKTGWRLLFQHGTSAAFMYRSGVLERELRFAHEKAWEGLMPPIDCLVRSHTHYYVDLHRAKDAACITPCFQLPTDYSESGSLGYKPVIGGVIIKLEKARNAVQGIKFELIDYDLPDEFLSYWEG